VTASPPRRRYAGRGVAELPTKRTGAPVVLLSDREATLLPDPLRAHEAMRARFIKANGTVPGSPANRPEPRLTIRDIKLIANHLTFALRNDLPTIDASDAAVIWEKWRQAVNDVRALMKNVDDDHQALVVASILEHRLWDVHESLATALATPGEVFRHYCPWRADWATYERLHPEAV